MAVWKCARCAVYSVERQAATCTMCGAPAGEQQPVTGAIGAIPALYFPLARFFFFVVVGMTDADFQRAYREGLTLREQLRAEGKEPDGESWREIMGSISHFDNMAGIINAWMEMRRLLYDPEAPEDPVLRRKKINSLRCIHAIENYPLLYGIIHAAAVLAIILWYDRLRGFFIDQSPAMGWLLVIGGCLVAGFLINSYLWVPLRLVSRHIDDLTAYLPFLRYPQQYLPLLKKMRSIVNTLTIGASLFAAPIVHALFFFPTDAVGMTLFIITLLICGLLGGVWTLIFGLWLLFSLRKLVKMLVMELSVSFVAHRPPIAPSPPATTP